MRQNHVVDGGHFFEREVAHPGARIDEQVGVDQERGGAAVFGNGA
ncbi:Uncharacterised protein [Mycobacterium tuberculosis]|nr:Uncharacterised protein [Mycobacterium tuberculosis]